MGLSISLDGDVMQGNRMYGSVYRLWIWDCGFWIGNMVAALPSNPKSKIRETKWRYAIALRCHGCCAHADLLAKACGG